MPLKISYLFKTKYLKNGFTNLFNHGYGRCNICGHYTIFFCSDIETARNNMICVFCHSDSRNRHVALSILKSLFPTKSSLSNIDSNIKIYNMSVNNSLARKLSSYRYYYQSELLENVQVGTEISERHYCQDVENLSFNDKSFDLVISEDIFEHVRDSDKGFREVNRVLKLGGFHIFTVPFYYDRETIIRVDVNGKDDIYLLPKEYHGDPRRGRILAYRNYGIDLFKKLSMYGFFH